MVGISTGFTNSYLVVKNSSFEEFFFAKLLSLNSTFVRYSGNSDLNSFFCRIFYSAWSQIVARKYKIYTDFENRKIDIGRYYYNVSIDGKINDGWYEPETQSGFISETDCGFKARVANSDIFGSTCQIRYKIFDY